MARPTDDERAARLADAEALLLRGWTRHAALELARAHGVGERAVRGWRAAAAEQVRSRSRAAADPAVNLADALDRLELLWTASLAAGDLRTARAVNFDRCRLLGLLTVRLDVRAEVNQAVEVLTPAELCERRAELAERLGVTGEALERLRHPPHLTPVRDPTKH